MRNFNFRISFIAIIVLFTSVCKLRADNIQVGSTTRNMNVYVPQDLPQNSPLIISMHGANQDANYQQSQAKWEPIADTAKFVVVFPNGINNQWDLGGNSDIDFILAIIDNMKSRYGIDTKRVYLSGFSMGGMMTYYATTKIADKIAAFAPISGYLMGNQTPNSSRPIPIIHTHGTGDNVVPYYAGNSPANGVYFSGIESIMAGWAARNACPSTAQITSPYPTTNPNSICTKSYWGLGTDGVSIVLMTLKDKGHWISNDIVNGIHTSGEIWKFCKKYSLTPNIGNKIQEGSTGFCSVDGTIDNNNAGYTGNGYSNTDDIAGKGINWRIEFSADATKTFSFLYASTIDKTADLIVNGTTIASNINFPSTGSLTNWDTVTVVAPVNPGLANLRLEAKSNDGLPNIDYVAIIGDTPADCGISIVTDLIEEDATGFCSVDGVVEAINTGYSGNGYAKTETQTGKGINYKIEFAYPGIKTLKFRYACDEDKTGQLIVNGTTIANNITFQSTGSLSTWNTVTVFVPTTPGVADVRLEATSIKGLANIDNLELSGGKGVDCQIEVIKDLIQENAKGFCSVNGTIDSNNGGFTGPGFANTSNASGNGVSWKINFLSDGIMSFNFRYASTTNRPAKLLVNNAEVVSNITLPASGSWTTWSTYSISAQLNAGIASVRLEATGGDGLPNIDYLEVIGGIAHDCVTTDVEITANPLETVGMKEYYTLQGQRVYTIDNLTGLYIVRKIMSDGSVQSSKEWLNQ